MRWLAVMRNGQFFELPAAMAPTPAAAVYRHHGDLCVWL